MMPEPKVGKVSITEYQKRWLVRARVLNRLVWASFALLLLVSLLVKAGLPPTILYFAGWVALPILIVCMFFVFCNSCPRCERNFYVSCFGVFCYGNPFTSRCMHCRLSWKDLE